MVTCLQQQINMSCGIFQELVKNLDMAFPNMTITNRQDLYPTLRSFLTNQQNVSGSACSQNTNSSAWLTLNFGKFSKLGNFSDFTTLYSNFSALDVLSLLNMQQIADFSVNFNPGNNSAAIDNIMAAISNGSSVLDFLTLLNVAASSRNISSLQPLLAQALLNKTFEALKANISSFNSSNWTTLIQVNLTNILTEITPDQLTLISANLTCDSYQAIIKGLDMKFQQMTTAKQQSIFQTFEKPFLDKQGSNCSKNLNSNDLIYLNMRNFSQFFDFSYFQTLNANFSAMNVLPLLTIPQRVNFTLGANFTDVQAASLAGSLQNTSDVYSFLDQLNAAVSMRNISSLQPLLAQALLNKTFEALKANISSFNSSDWTKLFQGNLTNILTEITPGQLTLISANLTCDSYQAIIKGLDMKFQQMTAAKQQSVFQTFVKPFLDKQGSNCSKNLNSSDLVYQNMRNFSQFFDFSYFQTLNANFSAMNVLPLLTIPQRVNFTLGANFTDVQAASLAGSLQNTSDVYSFLDQLNAAVSMKNQSMLQPPLSQALLNRTFDVFKSNFSNFSSSDWSQLFQNKLSLVLSVITPDQLNLIPSQNLSCDSYQAMVAGLDAKFSQMNPKTQQDVFGNLIQPYMKNNGPACSNNSNSGVLLKQNFGNFSKLANFSEIVSDLGNKFNAFHKQKRASRMNILLHELKRASHMTIFHELNRASCLTILFHELKRAIRMTILLHELKRTSHMTILLHELKRTSHMTILLHELKKARHINILLHELKRASCMTIHFHELKRTSHMTILLHELKKARHMNILLHELKRASCMTIHFHELKRTSHMTILLHELKRVNHMTILFHELKRASHMNILLHELKRASRMTILFNELKRAIRMTILLHELKRSSHMIILFHELNRASCLTILFHELKRESCLNILFEELKRVDVLPSLTVKQLVDFTSNTTMNAQTANSITGVIQNPTDLYGFFTGYNAALLSKNQTIDPSLSSALLAKTFQVMQSNFSTFTSSNWTDLFQDKLKNVLPNITSNQLQLLPKNLSCDSYQVILKSLDSKFSQMSTGTRKDVYNTFIKSNLITQDSPNVIFCYNQSNANSSNWFVTNMASFLSFTSEGDLIRFANYSMLQTFATDPSSVNLASTLNFSGDTATYYTSLLTSSAGFNLSSLSGPLLCFLQPSALTNLTAGNEALAFISKFNKQCSSTATGSVSANPTPQELQLATSLVSKLTNFTSATITSLGQTAVGLSPGQIGKISDADLKSSVSSLASVTGWTTGQTRSIMNKLLQSNFSITNLTSLGSLVSGLPSDKLLALDPKSVLTAVSDTQFASKLSNAPPTLQNAIVKQILAADSNTSNIVKNVPGNLVSFIPSSKLIFKPALQDVNSKSWTPNQAAMFFDDVITSTNNYDQISSSVLQGFTCNTPNKIDNNQLKTLAKVMNTQSVSLSEAQLTCLSRQVTKNGYPTDLDQYPKEVFLFLNATSYINGSISCKDYYTKVGAANVSVLQKGSNLRNKLLSQALSCLNVTGSSLTDGNIQTLGQLACDLNSSFIESSSGSKTLLSSLSQCTSFSDAQQTSIQKVLSSTNSAFGSSSTWTTDTLNSLGGIVPYLNQTIIGNVPTTFFNPWMKTSVQSSNLSRNQLANFVKYRIATKSRRAAGCPSGMQITADNVKDDLLPLSYTTTTLDACLDNDTLTSYLYILSSKAFTNEQLQVLKNRLNVLYPGGYPDSILSNLGAISLLCTDADINKWNISVDTLGTLLAVGPPDNVSQSIIAQYVKLGNPLSGSAINAIGSSRICLLNSTLLNLISSSSLSDAQPLDVSACNQTVKDALYIKASASYQDSANTAAYYNLIKPYLGGAPLADLKALAAKSPNMDISTFVKLNPNSVVNLTVSDVKSLLGNNTVDLLTQLSSPTVSQWIQNKKQTDLDTLNLGIQGGIRDTATTIATPTTKASAASPVFLQSLSFVLTVVWVVFLF
ncbi:mesothelin [Mantella aurantiaca]